MPDLQWMNDALCLQIDGELFFPHANENALTAKKACSLCRVQAECLEYALTMDVDGIWAGTTRSQRSKLRRGAA